MADKVTFPKRAIFNENSSNRQRSGSPVFELLNEALANNPDARDSLIKVVSGFSCQQFTAHGLDGDTPMRYASQTSVLDRVARWHDNVEEAKPTAAYLLSSEDGIRHPIVGLASFIDPISLLPNRIRSFMPESGRRLFTGWFDTNRVPEAGHISPEGFAYKALVTAMGVAKTAQLQKLDLLLVPEAPSGDSALTVIEHTLAVPAIKKLGFKQKGEKDVVIENKKYAGMLLRLSFN